MLHILLSSGAGTIGQLVADPVPTTLILTPPQETKTKNNNKIHMYGIYLFFTKPEGSLPCRCSQLLKCHPGQLDPIHILKLFY
jgi:hypothetical protein